MDMQPSYEFWGWIIPLAAILLIVMLAEATTQLWSAHRSLEAACCAGVGMFFSFLFILSLRLWMSSI